MGARFLPDRLLRLHDVPRTVSLVVLAALTVAAALLNAFATLPLLGLAAFLSGFSFGGFQVLSERSWVWPLSLRESMGAWLISVSTQCLYEST